MKVQRTLLTLGLLTLGACGLGMEPAASAETQAATGAVQDAKPADEPTSADGDKPSVVHPDTAPWSTASQAACDSLHASQSIEPTPCIDKVTFGYASAGVHWQSLTYFDCGIDNNGNFGCDYYPYENYNLRWGPLSVSRGSWLQGHFGSDVLDVSLNSLERNTPYGVIIEGQRHDGNWTSWSSEIDFQTTP